MRSMENQTEIEQDQKKKRQSLAQVMGGEMIPVTIELFDPYVKFAKEYMQFFNVKDSLPIFLMRLIYDGLENLHRNLTEYVDSEAAKHFVDGTDWYNKNPHIACTSCRRPDEDC